MNIYIVTEGLSEKMIYPNWIKYVNPKLSSVEYVDKINNDNFYIVSGGGWPGFKQVILNAIEDVNQYRSYDRLVISVDSENNTYQEKLSEIQDLISGTYYTVDIKIIIQHFCIETWGLANKKIISQNPKNQTLKTYINFFNVRDDDPENLPPYADEELNRAQFAAKYLSKALNDRSSKITYSKNNPKQLFPRYYFNQIKKRFEADNHINSFSDFLNAFV